MIARDQGYFCAECACAGKEGSEKSYCTSCASDLDIHCKLLKGMKSNVDVMFVVCHSENGTFLRLWLPAFFYFLIMFSTL